MSKILIIVATVSVFASKSEVTAELKSDLITLTITPEVTELSSSTLIRCTAPSRVDGYENAFLILNSSETNSLFTIVSHCDVNSGFDSERMEIESCQVTDAALRISIVHCSDACNYKCTVGYNNGTVEFLHTYAQLYVEAPLMEGPTLRNWDPSSDEDVWTVKEDYVISIFCTGNTGCPNQGELRWRIFRKDEVEIVDPSDSRIREWNEGLIEGDIEGSVRVESTIDETVTLDDQYMVIECYVKNTYDTDGRSSKCRNKLRDLCDHTKPIVIVRNLIHDGMTLILHNINELEEGDDLTLVCDTDAYPLPTFYWRKKDDETRRLSGEQFATKNVLIIRDVVQARDNGIYICCATHVIEGTTHEAEKEIDIKISESTSTRPREKSQFLFHDEFDEETESETSQKDAESNHLFVYLLLGIGLLVLLLAVIIWAIASLFMVKRAKAPTPKISDVELQPPAEDSEDDDEDTMSQAGGGSNKSEGGTSVDTGRGTSESSE